MADDPIDAVYSYVERAYIRLQAGDVLIRCIEDGSAEPMHQMVEGLVLAGPRSLATLREILAETGQRKSQVQDDLSQVFSELQNNLKSYGIHLRETITPAILVSLSSADYQGILQEQGMSEENDQPPCMQLLKDNRDLMVTFVDHIRLLEEIETYLQDWLWGLAYQSARQQSNNPETTQSGPSL